MYQYPGGDSNLSCDPFKSQHRVKLSVSDLNHQLADDGELPLFLVIQKYLAGAEGHDNYLDVGCGTGRIITMFAGLFRSATCLEADAARIATARSYWQEAQWGLTRNLAFKNLRFGLEYGTRESFDAISCIQVVQHIPGSVLRWWFTKMFKLLKPHGVLVLATTNRKRDMFRLSDGSQVTQDEFDAMAAHSDDGRLAVRAFSPGSLQKLVNETGFTIWEHTFSTYGLRVRNFPNTQIVVAGKRPMPDAVKPSTAHINDIHVPAFLSAMKMRQRRQCKRPCRDQLYARTPADFLCASHLRAGMDLNGDVSPTARNARSRGSLPPPYQGYIQNR